MNRQRLIVILGPTAVGKTKLAIQLAHHLDTEIISGDSMLVYRGFDIGTAKPTWEEREGIPHHLIDVLEPSEQFSVVDFQRMAKQRIDDLQKRGRIPILAGGTALYIKALLEGYSFCETPASPEYRNRLEAVAETRGAEHLHEMLKLRNPEVAARIHPQNVRRVIRALEILELGKGQMASERSYEHAGELRYRAYVIGLSRRRDELYRRINARVLQMFEQGLGDEVKALLSKGVQRGAPAMQGIGYKETAAWLAGECSREDAITRIQASTRHFAKRQMTWYRRMPYIHWYDLETIAEEELLAVVVADIERFFQEISVFDTEKESYFNGNQVS